MIRLIDVNKRYKNKVILDNLKLEIPRGEIIGLLAPNGEGKSTLLKILGGQISYDHGTYEFEGEAFRAAHKGKIGYMCDQALMPGGWLIKDCVSYYVQYFERFNPIKCAEILQKFGLEQGMKVKTLSKGENEKLHLALALGVEGSVYILDEPLAAVDLLAREAIIKMILEHFDPESTMILSSHLVADIEMMLDRVLLLKDGKIVRNEMVEELRMEGKSVVKLYKEVYGNAVV
ncbi:MAG: ATP-binding cassette domain-containing protein [Cellulosilyticaceae bacterium]